MGWYNSNWLYRKKITIDYTKISAPSGGLSNFPIYIDLTDLDSDFFTNVKSDGSDIVVTTSDGTTKLKRELVSIDTGSGQSGELWVKIPSLDDTSNTDIYIYYGNSGASETNDTDTWNSDFSMVQHLNEDNLGSGAVILDSTSNNNDGTPSGIGSGQSINAKIYEGLDMDGSDDEINHGNNSSLDLNGNFTIALWWYQEAVNANEPIILGKGNISSARSNYHLISAETGISLKISLSWYNGGWQNHYSDGTVSLNEWHRIIITYDGTNLRYYFDGTLDSTKTPANTPITNSDNIILAFIEGLADNNRRFDGIIDEVYILKGIALDANWVATDYANQNSPSTFYTVGTEQDYDVPEITTLSATNIDRTIATLNGNVDNLDSGESLKVCFEYWKNESGASHMDTALQDKENEDFNQALTGLDDSTEYKFKAKMKALISDGSIDDEDMIDISDWSDVDSGDGESTQVTFDDKSCMKLDSGSAGGGNYARRQQDLGSFGNRTILSLNSYYTNLGVGGSANCFKIRAYTSTHCFDAELRSNGLYIKNSSAVFIQIDSDIVIQNTWQIWTFDVDWITQTVDIYLDGILQYSNIDCGWASGFDDGTVMFFQFGTTDANRITYIDWLKVGSDTDYIDLYEGEELTFTTNYIYEYQTDLRLALDKDYTYVTNLDIVNRVTTTISTDLRVAGTIEDTFYTDLRVIKTSSSFDGLEPNALNDIVVKLGGSELIDVDYNSLRLNFALNSTPSSATFRLARKHDDLDYQLDGTLSEITDENKIEIYDGDILLFTGYITQINSESESDTVTITAEDIRYKLKRDYSLTIDYGFGNTYPSTRVAIEYIISQILSLISGYDEIFFGFVPEPTEVTDNVANLLDTFIGNTANINWYIDENERLRFCKIGEGITKNLRLSGINERRHVYDIILNSVTLNKKTDDYVQSYKVHLGKRYDYYWQRSRWNPGSGEEWWFPRSEYDEFAMFMFQNRLYGGLGIEEYIGMNLPRIYIVKVAGIGYTLYQWIIGQWLSKLGYWRGGKEIDLTPVIIGSGEPQKDLFLTSYGIRRENGKWEERTVTEEARVLALGNQGIGLTVGDVWLTEVTGENFDQTAFAEDLAKFELSQNNQLITESTITLLLDSYEYYNLSFKNLINIVNTTRDGIYEDNNGFPLNINSISIDCSNRIVTLNLTNYGKTYYEKTVSLNSYYRAEFVRWLKPRMPQWMPPTGDII